MEQLTKLATWNPLSFYQGSSRTFAPPQPALPVRTWSTAPKREQVKCKFLSRLPPEVRNEIYRWVFISNDHLTSAIEEPAPPLPTYMTHPGQRNPPLPKLKAKERTEPHPLSLLLTCRQIAHEAMLIAYAQHTFTLHHSAHSAPPTLYFLRRRTAHLPAAQLTAITSVAYVRGRDVPGTEMLGVGDEVLAGDVVAGCVRVFPALKQVRVGVRTREWTMWHGRGAKAIGVGKVPAWMVWIMKRVRESRHVTWAEGEDWQGEWPEACRDVDTGECSVEALERRGLMPCGCGCRDMCWVRMDLVQKGGRRIEVEAFRLWSDLAEEERENQVLRLTLASVALVEGAPRLKVRDLKGRVVGEGEELGPGFGWDGEELGGTSKTAQGGSVLNKLWSRFAGWKGKEDERVVVSLPADDKVARDDRERSDSAE